MALRVPIFILAILLVLGLTGADAANQLESRAFNAAAHSFRAGVWERAEAELAEFAAKFPASPRVYEAILLQAEARLELTNYAGAIQLLSTHEAQAGPWRDQYLFWLGEAWFRQGNHKEAVDYFSRVLKEFPASSRRVQAGLSHAAALAHLKQWEPLIASLQETGGWFESAAKSNPTNQLLLRGFLLLGEAQLAMGRPAAAAAALERAAGTNIPPSSAWQRGYLLIRVRLAEGKLAEALQQVTNLYAYAAETGQRHLQTESYALGASLLEKAGRTEEAIQLYTNNLVEGVSPERQTEALLRITALFASAGKPLQAAVILEKFLAQYPQSPAAPIALLNLGEIRLKHHLATESGPPAAGGTNFLTLAIQSLTDLTNKHPQHPSLGRACLNLGWCFWRAAQMPASEISFRLAANNLTEPYEKAVALFKLGDTQYQQEKATNAVATYQQFVKEFGDLPEIRTNLLERGLYQLVRAALASQNVGAAEASLQRILKDFPNGFFTDDAALITGQERRKTGDPAAARGIFQDFLTKAPGAGLVPEVHLALARTYQQQEMWTNAVAEYTSWLEVNTNHTARAAAEYYRAWSEFQAGNVTNAITAFTNLVSRYNDALFAPLAQLWVADYHFGRGDAVEAEKNYKALFQNTNLPPSDFIYQARLMAGRAALARQGWADGISHFTNITSDLNCPADLRIQAMFAYGDALMKMDSPETNKLANLETAIEVFTKICDTYPTNHYAALAWGQKANCLLQWAQFSNDYSPVTNAFYQVVDSPLASGTARCIAKVGLGLVLEKQAEQLGNSQRQPLLIAARNHYLDVFYGKVLREGEKTDPFWTRKAGWDAGRISETLLQWAQAASIYEQLQKAFPVLTPRLERYIRKAHEQLNRNG